MPSAHQTPISALSWLSKLKVAQLHRIAVATGVQSSGAKAVLAQRLSDELQLNNDGSKDVVETKPRLGNGKGTDDAKPMSILSIDMGIRNLAYAHIIVPSRASTLDGGKLKQHCHTPILNAWTRLAVSSFPTSSETHPSYPIIPSSTPREDKKHQPTLADDQVNALDSGQSMSVKESFSPNLYASHAYTLMTSLLTTYKPTHVLIERQRFRSAGSSSVLEWTIRVGVFEGMLYAVLNTLRGEGRLKALLGADSDVDVAVQGIEPRRVVTYWTEGDTKPSGGSKDMGIEKAGEKEGQERKKTAKTPRAKEVKREKINLVAKWWLSFFSRKDSPEMENSESLKISLAEDSQVKDVVDAYLRKWENGNSDSKGIKGGSRKGKGIDKVGNDESPVTKIKKLDDLADCLLQGIAWLEWRDMRRKMARDGPDAVPWLGEEHQAKTKTKKAVVKKKQTRSRRKLDEDE
jgi:cruciform cutting endonuclease 1